MFYNVVSPGNVNRNDFQGEVGAFFSNFSGETVVITELGRWVLHGNNQSHTLSVYDLESDVLMGMVEVDCKGVNAGEFVWGRLSTPIEVSPNQVIALMSSERSGGDQWVNAYSSPRLPGGGEFIGKEDIGAFGSATRVEGGELTSTGGWGLTHGHVSFKYSSPVPGWTKEGNVYTTNGEYFQIRSAIEDSSSGDIIGIPEGRFFWDRGISINRPVTLQGAGIGETIIDIGKDATPGWTTTLISLTDGATLKGISFYDSPEAKNNLFSTGAAKDWRVTEVEYVQQGGQGGYFGFIQYSERGLIDNCVITGDAGNAELVFVRGPTNAWDVPNTLGSSNNVFIENCTWNGSGYVCDANSAARVVVRYNTINGGIKVDGHGVWSNGGPQLGVRHMEVYGNRWTKTDGAWPAIEMRGGTGMVFDNAADAENASNMAWFYLTEYGVFNNNGAFYPNFQTPADYPIRDQIGRGMYQTPGDWRTAVGQPMYVWNNLKGGSAWPLSYKVIKEEALNHYRSQTGDENASFGWEDVVRSDRDYFRQVHGGGFDGSSGVGVGTFSEMRAIVPTKVGVGFWVTDKGEWNETNGEMPDGELYRWNGSSWALHYVPYLYPHPGFGPRVPSDPSNLRFK
ncbi:glycosyl hydrolase family 28-related protein [Pelagicoccus sp. SDUM812003]|nr:glycosyl hydrolase family 28-related protein [Pelagicoccus sp. SDUM812003]